MALMSINKYRMRFEPGSRPALGTVMAYIKNGTLYGEQPGGPGTKWWVDPDVTMTPDLSEVVPVNDLAAKTLALVQKAS